MRILVFSLILYFFDQHISNTVSKCYFMLGLMQRNFRELSRDCFVSLYKSLARHHVFRVCQHCLGTENDIICDIEKIEKVQKRQLK